MGIMERKTETTMLLECSGLGIEGIHYGLVGNG